MDKSVQIKYCTIYYFISVFHDMGYFEAVNSKAKQAMKMASLEEKSTPFCEVHNGVVVYFHSFNCTKFRF